MLLLLDEKCTVRKMYSCENFFFGAREYRKVALLGAGSTYPGNRGLLDLLRLL